MKIVIDVPERFNPIRGDVLCYDGEKWDCANKAVLFADERHCVAELTERLAQAEKSVEDMQSALSEMASIMKGEIEND